MENSKNTNLDEYKARLADIGAEFEKGFSFISSYPKSVTFFGSSQTKPDNSFYKDAEALAKKIVEKTGYSILTGGSSGIMEAANKGAVEAGGDSLGLHIELPKEQEPNRFATKSISFHYFFIRKVCLSFSAEAFVFYPGGFGTLDEFFEILTLIQTKKIPPSPVICVGSEYWNKLSSLIQAELLNRGAIESVDMNIFTITDNHDEIVEIIKKAPIRTTLPLNGRNHSH